MQKTQKRGRPALGGIRVAIRLPQEARDKYQAAADAEMIDLSEYLRRALAGWHKIPAKLRVQK